MNAKQQYILAYRLYRLFVKERALVLRKYGFMPIHPNSGCGELLAEIQRNVAPKVAGKALQSLNDKAKSG